MIEDEQCLAAIRRQIFLLALTAVLLTLLVAGVATVLLVD
jgi:hypothetical protein